MFIKVPTVYQMVVGVYEKNASEKCVAKALVTSDRVLFHQAKGEEKKKKKRKKGKEKPNERKKYKLTLTGHCPFRTPPRQRRRRRRVKRRRWKTVGRPAMMPQELSRARALRMTLAATMTRKR